MALPKRRTSRARSRKRRSHQAIQPVNATYCRQCNEPVLPHHVCGNCGHYRGRTAVAVKEE